MPGMTKKELIMALKKRGVPQNLIHEKANCSATYAKSILRETRQKKFRGYTESNCIYSGLRTWLNINKIYPYKLAEMVLGDGSDVSAVCMKRKLSGYTTMDVDTAIKLVQASGRSFEELFMWEGT